MDRVALYSFPLGYVSLGSLQHLKSLVETVYRFNRFLSATIRAGNLLQVSDAILSQVRDLVQPVRERESV